jgi:hypothetical protein
MKTFKLLICALVLFSHLHAQNERSAFRRGYLRLGISSLGSGLDNNLSPKQNVFNGNYGASSGFVFESGHNYYFKSRTYDGKINFGLDWTILSLTYNKVNKWNGYADARQTGGYVDGSDFSISFASKLGPVVSFNPVEKLVIDVRFQAAAIGRVTPFTYYENEEHPDFNSFAFYDYGEEGINGDYDASSVKNTVAFGIGSNFGVTVRRKALGLSVDYSSVKAKTNYDAYEGQDNHSFGSQKIPTHSLQVKLSFTF